MTLRTNKKKMLVTEDILLSAIFTSEDKVWEFLHDAQQNFSLYFAFKDTNDWQSRFYAKHLDAFEIKRSKDQVIDISLLHMLEENGKLTDFDAILTDKEAIEDMSVNDFSVYYYLQYGYDEFFKSEIMNLQPQVTISKMWNIISQDVAVKNLIENFFDEENSLPENIKNTKVHIESLLYKHFTQVMKREWKDSENNREEIIKEYAGIRASEGAIEAALDWIEKSALRSLRNG